MYVYMYIYIYYMYIESSIYSRERGSAVESQWGYTIPGGVRRETVSSTLWPTIETETERDRYR